MQPETDRGLLARFSIAEPIQIHRLLDDLVRARATVALFAADDADAFVVSRLLACERELLRFDFIDDAQRGAPLLRGGMVVAVAMLERIKIQFDAGQPRRQDVGGVPELHCAVPGRLIRLQRREAFRVRPPGRGPALCVLRDPQGIEWPCPIQDISVAGVGLAVPPGGPPLQAGEYWHHCRLELPGLPPIPCDLEVRACAPGPLPGMLVAGCGFHRPTPESQRAVQRYVMDVERGRLTDPARV